MMVSWYPAAPIWRHLASIIARRRAPATLQQMLRDIVQELNAEKDKLRLLIHRLVRHLSRYRPSFLRGGS
jgi:hypothetical protein